MNAANEGMLGGGGVDGALRSQELLALFTVANGSPQVTHMFCSGLVSRRRNPPPRRTGAPQALPGRPARGPDAPPLERAVPDRRSPHHWVRSPQRCVKCGTFHTCTVCAASSPLAHTARTLPRPSSSQGRPPAGREPRHPHRRPNLQPLQPRRIPRAPPLRLPRLGLPRGGTRPTPHRLPGRVVRRVRVPAGDGGGGGAGGAAGGERRGRRRRRAQRGP